MAARLVGFCDIGSCGLISRRWLRAVVEGRWRREVVGRGSQRRLSAAIGTRGERGAGGGRKWVGGCRGRLLELGLG